MCGVFVWGEEGGTVDGIGSGEGDERAGYFAHEADCAAAVDELGVCGVEGVSEGARGFHVRG